MTAISLYETDFYAWAMHNALLLREKRISELDFEHLAEEIESVGTSERRELQSRLEVLIAHLLKLHYLDQLRAQNERGWLATVKEQRKKITQSLTENPSLKAKVSTLFAEAYSSAIYQVVAQLGISESIFPDTCPYSLEKTLDNDFYP